MKHRFGGVIWIPNLWIKKLYIGRGPLPATAEKNENKDMDIIIINIELYKNKRIYFFGGVSQNSRIQTKTRMEVNKHREYMKQDIPQKFNRVKTPLKRFAQPEKEKETRLPVGEAKMPMV